MQKLPTDLPVWTEDVARQSLPRLCAQQLQILFVIFQISGIGMTDDEEEQVDHFVSDMQMSLIDPYR